MMEAWLLVGMALMKMWAEVVGARVGEFLLATARSRVVTQDDRQSKPIERL